MPAASSFSRQITGLSDISVGDSIARTLAVARDGYGEPDWFDVVTACGFISNGRVTHYQVKLNLGYEAVNQGAADDFYFQRACGSARNMTEYHTMEARL